MGEAKKIVEEADVLVQYIQQKKHPMLLVVAQEGPNLLGWKWLNKLHISELVANWSLKSTHTELQ